jgi:hypothetical protein
MAPKEGSEIVKVAMWLDDRHEARTEGSGIKGFLD